MNDLIEFLTSQEIIVVYILIGVACFLYFVIYLFDKTYYKRKRKQNTKELNKIIEDVHQLEPQQQAQAFYQEPTIETISSQANISPVIKASEPTQIEITPVSDAMPEITSIEVVPEPIIEKPIILEPIENKIENLVLDNMLGVKEEVQIVQSRSQNNTAELQYTDIEPNKTEAQAELQKLTETLETATKETQSIRLTVFEEEQEQNAIISLDELMTKGKAMYENNEFEKFEDEGDEPISLQDIELRMNKQKEPTVEVIAEQPVRIEPVQEKMVVDEFNSIQLEESKPLHQESKKFHSSPVISPVYGIEKNVHPPVTEISLENTANYDKLDEEIKKTNEFLMTLKELQKKLE